MKDSVSYLSFRVWEEVVYGFFFSIRSNAEDEKLDFLSRLSNRALAFTLYSLYLLQLIPLIGEFTHVFSCDYNGFMCFVSAISSPLSTISHVTNSMLVRSCIIFGLCLVHIIILSSMLYVAVILRKQNFHMTWQRELFVAYITIMLKLYFVDVFKLYINTFVCDTSLNPECWDRTRILAVVAAGVPMLFMFVLMLFCTAIHNKLEMASRRFREFAHGHIELAMHIFYLWCIVKSALREHLSLGMNLFFGVILMILSGSILVFQMIQSPLLNRLENMIRATVFSVFFVTSALYLFKLYLPDDEIDYTAYALTVIVVSTILNRFSNYRLDMFSRIMQDEINVMTGKFDEDYFLGIQSLIMNEFADNESYYYESNRFVLTGVSHERIEKARKKHEDFKQSSGFAIIRKKLVFGTDTELLLRDIIENWGTLSPPQKLIAKTTVFQVFLALFQQRDVSCFAFIYFGSMCRMIFYDYHIASSLLQVTKEYSTGFDSKYGCFISQKLLDIVKVKRTLKQRNNKGHLADLASFRKTLQQAKMLHEKSLRMFIKIMKNLISDDNEQMNLDTQKLLSPRSSSSPLSSAPLNQGAITEDANVVDKVKMLRDRNAIQLKQHADDIDTLLNNLSLAETMYTLLVTRYPTNGEGLRAAKLFRSHFFKDDWTAVKDESNKEPKALQDVRSTKNSIENESVNKEKMHGEMDDALTNDKSITVSSTINSLRNEKESIKYQKLELIMGTCSKNFSRVLKGSFVGLLLITVMIVVIGVVIVQQLNFVVNRIQSLEMMESLYSDWPQSCVQMNNIIYNLRNIENNQITPGRDRLLYYSGLFKASPQAPDINTDIAPACDDIIATGRLSNLYVLGCLYGGINDIGYRKYRGGAGYDEAVPLSGYINSQSTTDPTRQWNWWYETKTKFETNAYIDTEQLWITESSFVDGVNRYVVTKPIVNSLGVFQGVLGLELVSDGSVEALNASIASVIKYDEKLTKATNSVISIASGDGNTKVISIFTDSNIPYIQYSPYGGSETIHVGLQQIQTQFSSGIANSVLLANSRRFGNLRNHPSFLSLMQVCIGDSNIIILDVLRYQMEYVNSFVDNSVGTIAGVVSAAIVLIILSTIGTLVIIRYLLSNFDATDGIILPAKILMNLQKSSKKLIYKRFKMIRIPRRDEEYGNNDETELDDKSPIIRGRSAHASVEENDDDSDIELQNSNTKKAGHATVPIIGNNTKTTERPTNDGIKARMVPSRETVTSSTKISGEKKNKVMEELERKSMQIEARSTAATYVDRYSNLEKTPEVKSGQSKWKKVASGCKNCLGSCYTLLQGKISQRFVFIWIVIAVYILSTSIIAMVDLTKYKKFQNEITTVANSQILFAASAIRMYEYPNWVDVTERKKTNEELKSEYNTILSASVETMRLLINAEDGNISIGRRYPERSHFLFDNVCINPAPNACVNPDYTDPETMQLGFYKAFLAYVERGRWLYQQFNVPINQVAPSIIANIHWLNRISFEIMIAYNYVRTTFIDEATFEKESSAKKEYLFLAGGCLLVLILMIIAFKTIKKHVKDLRDTQMILTVLPWQLILEEKIIQKYFSQNEDEIIDHDTDDFNENDVIDE